MIISPVNKITLKKKTEKKKTESDIQHGPQDTITKHATKVTTSIRNIATTKSHRQFVTQRKQSIQNLLSII